MLLVSELGHTFEEQVLLATLKLPTIPDNIIDALPDYQSYYKTVIREDLPYNLDAWDGYPAERKRFLNTVRSISNKNITGLSMHLVPRTTLAQKMDALSSQANIAGYKAVLMGSSHMNVYMPLLMTAAGTIRPAKVLILGAGVAGLQAIATAKRLGAQVEAFDVRPEVKEQVESLGAKFVEVSSESDDGVGEGGYAKETSDEYKQKQQELIKEHISKADMVVTTALIPGRKAPILIGKDVVELMKPGSVIMDLAAENGGNCSLTKPDELVNIDGVTIDGTVNLAGTMSVHASQLYSKNVCAFFKIPAKAVMPCGSIDAA